MKVNNLKKRITLFILILMPGLCAIAQHPNNPAHVLAFETGMFNRGLAGAGYQRLFIQKERVMLGGGAGLGIGGVPFGGAVNQFYYLAFSTGIGFVAGKTQFYLGPGIDLKYIHFHNGVYEQTIADYVSVHYEGVGAMPYLGLSIIEENVFLQLRGAPLFLMNGLKIKDVFPGVGLTAGYILR